MIPDRARQWRRLAVATTAQNPRCWKGKSNPASRSAVCCHKKGLAVSTQTSGTSATHSTRLCECARKWVRWADIAARRSAIMHNSSTDARDGVPACARDKSICPCRACRSARMRTGAAAMKAATNASRAAKKATGSRSASMRQSSKSTSNAAASTAATCLCYAYHFQAMPEQTERQANKRQRAPSGDQRKKGGIAPAPS